RRLPRTGPLEHVAHVLEPVLQPPAEIGVPRARHADPRSFLLLGRSRSYRHPPEPVLVVAVREGKGNGGSGRASEAHTGEDRRAVALDLLPRAAAVAA